MNWRNVCIVVALCWAWSLLALACGVSPWARVVGCAVIGVCTSSPFPIARRKSREKPLTIDELRDYVRVLSDALDRVDRALQDIRNQIENSGEGAQR